MFNPKSGQTTRNLRTDIRNKLQVFSCRFIRLFVRFVHSTSLAFNIFFIIFLFDFGIFVCRLSTVVQRCVFVCLLVDCPFIFAATNKGLTSTRREENNFYRFGRCCFALGIAGPYTEFILQFVPFFDICFFLSLLLAMFLYFYYHTAAHN